MVFWTLIVLLAYPTIGFEGFVKLGTYPTKEMCVEAQKYITTGPRIPTVTDAVCIPVANALDRVTE